MSERIPASHRPAPVLSRRLSAIAALVPDNLVVADICADHCLLAIWLVAHEVVPRAIAIDIAEEPAARGAARTREHGVEERVEVRVGDGFSALAPDEAALGIVAGIGGRAMVRMLSRARPALPVHTLILQPNKDGNQVRAWLDAEGWVIDDEALVEEKGRWFPIVRARRALAAATQLPPSTRERASSAARPTLSRAELILGPVLLRRGGVAFMRYAAHTLAWMRAAASSRRGASRGPDGRSPSSDPDVHALQVAMFESPHVQIRAISALETRPLRQQLLRPTLSVDALGFPGDEDPLSAHLGAFVEGQLVGIASVFRMAREGDSTALGSEDAWRLRGMAVVSELQGLGIGSRLVHATIEHASERGGRVYWCNARTPARRFYERLGLRTRGDEFTIPGAGPHYLMAREIGGAEGANH